MNVRSMKQKKTVEDYLKTIYTLNLRLGLVRGIDLARELQVSRPTVCVALKELEKEGYLFQDERHRTLQSFLRNLGVDEGSASKDACQMEHVISPDSYQALKKLLPPPRLESQQKLKPQQQLDRQEVDMARKCDRLILVS